MSDAQLIFAVTGFVIGGIWLPSALFAHALENRGVFLASMIGSFLGCVVQPPLRTYNGTAEVIYFAQMWRLSVHVFVYGVVGSAVLSFATYLLTTPHQRKKQFSLRSFLSICLAVSFLLAFYQSLQQASWFGE